MKLYVHMDHDEVARKLPYAIIAETASRSIWDTGRRKRMFATAFSDSEKNAVYEIIKQAKKMAFVKGVPDEGITTTATRLALWRKLGDFCASL